MKPSFLPLLTALLLVPIGVLPCLAQAPAYLHYGVSDGLPSGVVYCALQDQKGYMWFGTDKGLVRFDGTMFKVFGMKDGLPDNEVVNMFEDSKGRIWLSCFGQHPAYMLNGKIANASNDPLLAKMGMAGNFNFYEDQKHQVWIGSSSKTFYCLQDGRVDTYDALNSIHKVGEMGKDIYAFGFWFIYKILGQNKLDIQFTTPPPFFGVSAETIKKLKLGIEQANNSEFDFFSKTRHVSMVQSGNRVLYLYREGLLLLEFDNGSFKEIDRLLGVATATAYTDREGRFWVSNNDEGALCFDHRKHGLRHPEKFVEGKRVSQIYEDRENNTWFSTLNDGAYLLPKNAVQNYRVGTNSPLLSNNVISICKLLDGRLVAGDDKGHIYVQKGGAWEVVSIKEYVGYNRIRQILPLPDSTWMAVSDKAIVDEKKGILRLANSVGSYKSANWHKGKIWAGTSNHLMNWENGVSSPKFMVEGRTMVVFPDAQKSLWIGKLDGLFSEKDGFKKSWGNLFRPLASRILDIKQAGNDALWVATPDYGLLKVGVKQGEVVSVEIINDKLATPIENIQTIYAEPNGRVWLATNKGVFSIGNNLTIGHHGQINGLASDDVNAIFVDKDTLWAATVSGLSRLPLQQKDETGEFATRIVGVKFIADKGKLQYDLTTENPGRHLVSLPPGATMLEIELASLHYRTRGNLQFEYSTKEILLPFHAITFGNIINCLFGEKLKTDTIQGSVQNFGLRLTPGRFVNTATAILPGGIRSTQPDKIIITVLPYWWQTLWAMLLAFALVATFIVRMFKARAAFLKLQSTTAELHLQAIKSQMNPHFVGNSINAIQQFFYPPDPEKASEYISIFSDLLRRTMAFSEVDFIPFHDELQYLKDYLAMVELRFGEHFSYTISGHEGIEPQAMFPAMVLQPLLENATIHGLSPEGMSKLTVVFGKTQNRLTCTLTDNGVGIEESHRRKRLNPISRPSKGLELLQKKLQMLNQLYNADIKLATHDLGKAVPGKHGTQVVLSFLATGITKSKMAFNLKKH